MAKLVKGALDDDLSLTSRPFPETHLWPSSFRDPVSLLSRFPAEVTDPFGRRRAREAAEEVKAAEEREERESAWRKEHGYRLWAEASEEHFAKKEASGWYSPASGASD